MKQELEHLSDSNEIASNQNNGLESLNPSPEDLEKLDNSAKDLDLIDATNKLEQIQNGKKPKSVSFAGCWSCDNKCLNSCVGTCDNTCAGSCHHTKSK